MARRLGYLMNLLAGIFLVALAAAQTKAVDGTVLSPLKSSSRWILDPNNQRVKLRCANWAGHLEVKVPEGLHKQTPQYLASWLANNGFNCVRLTYAIDMALNQNQLISNSFSTAGQGYGKTQDLTNLYNNAVAKNPWMKNATTGDAFSHVVAALNDKGVRVILDNHVSHAQWCCNTTDGNGWFGAAAGYVASNSRYFDVNNWIKGLQAMASFAHQYPNVIGMSIRNELRAVGQQDGNNHADWYKYVTQAAQAIHNSNGDLLITIGGVSYAGDLSYLYSNPLDTSSWAGKNVWEFHSYPWYYSSSDCQTIENQISSKTGYLLTQNKQFTGPLWLSEWGVDMSLSDTSFLNCTVQYMSGNDAEWSYWALQGTYYMRDGAIDSSESYGLLDDSWSTWRNSKFPGMLGAMWNITQRP